MKKILALAGVLCGALCALAAGFDGKALATNDWFAAEFTALTAGSEVVLNSTTGIVYGAGSWTAVPTNGTATIAADADAGGSATMLSFEAGDEELEFTPAPLSSPTGMETTSTTVKGGAVSELPTAPGNVQAGFTVYDDGTNAVPCGLTSDGWTNLVYSGAMSGLTDAWYTLTLDFANVDNVRYVRYAVTPAGGSRTVLEDSLGTTWFPAASNATTITSVAFTGTGDVRSFSSESLEEAVATCNGVNYATVAAAIAAAGDGDTVTLLGAVTEGDTLTINKNVTLNFDGKAASFGGIVINEGKTLTITRANSNSNVIPTITGGGSLVVSGNNTFNWKGMAGTSTLASITQENASGGIAIYGYGTISVTGDVSVAATLTFYPNSAEATHVSNGFTIKMTANSVSAGTLNGGATIETEEGTTVGGGTFYGVIKGGLAASGNFTSQGAGLNGVVAVANGRKLTIGNRLASMSNIRFHLDATDAATYTLEDETSNLTQIKGGDSTYSLESGKTAAVRMAGDGDHFGGQPYFQFGGSQYARGSRVSARSYIAVTQPDFLSGYLAYYSNQDKFGIEGSAWIARCYSADRNGWLTQNGTTDRTATAATDTVVSLATRITASDNREDHLGNNYIGAIAEFVGFNSAISVEDNAAVEMSLMNKWNLAAAANLRPFASAAEVEVGAGSTLDLGGYVQTVASFTGGGVVTNGTLLTADNVYTNIGALAINAVDDMTVVLDAGATALTLVGDATNVSVTATDAFIASGASITVTASAIHAAGHSIDFSGIPSDIFRFGYVDNGDGTWKIGVQTSGFEAATYKWTNGSGDGRWETLGNWSVGDKSVAVRPQPVDTIKIDGTAAILLSITVSISNLTLNAQATFSGDQIMNVSEIGGTGLLRMNGIQIRNTSTVTLDFSNNVEVVAGSDHNEFSVVTDNKSNARYIDLRGNLTGNGYLTLRSRHSNNYYGVHLHGDNSAFAGTIYVYPYISDGKTVRNNTYLENGGASSSNAVWEVYNSGAHSFVHNGATAYFGVLNGNVYQLDSNIHPKPTLEIGALAGRTSMLDGVYSRTAADRRSSEGAIIRKVGEESTLVFSGTRTKQYQVNAGLFVLSGTADSDNITPVDGIVFGGGTLAVASSNIVDDAVVFADPSSAIKNSTAPICFSNAVDEVHTWATALADSNTGGLVKKGEGTLVLKEVPYYTGDTYLRGGTLKLPTSAGVKVKTDVVGKRITGRRETIEDVQYIVYELIDIQPGTVIRLI